MRLAGTVAGNQHEEKSENKEAGRGVRCARLKAPAPVPPCFASPADTCHHTVSGIHFILYFFALLWLSSFSALPSPHPPCFSSPPRGAFSETCSCVQTCGCSCLESRGVKSREYKRESRNTSARRSQFSRISCSPPSFNFGDILFILFPRFFLFWIGKSSARVEMAQLTPSDKTLIYSQSLKHKFSN